jgi:hypothetical protein
MNPARDFELRFLHDVRRIEPRVEPGVEPQLHETAQRGAMADDQLFESLLVPLADPRQQVQRFRTVLVHDRLPLYPQNRRLIDTNSHRA